MRSDVERTTDEPGQAYSEAPEMRAANAIFTHTDAAASADVRGTGSPARTAGPRSLKGDASARQSDGAPEHSARHSPSPVAEDPASRPVRGDLTASPRHHSTAACRAHPRSATEQMSAVTLPRPSPSTGSARATSRRHLAGPRRFSPGARLDDRTTLTYLERVRPTLSRMPRPRCTALLEACARRRTDALGRGKEDRRTSIRSTAGTTG